MRSRGLLGHFIPSGWSMPFAILGVGWVTLLGSAFAVTVVSAIAKGKAAEHELTTLMGITGAFLFPVGALLLVVAAVVAGRWAARSLLFAFALLMLLCGAAIIFLSAALDPNPQGALIVGVLFDGIPSLMVGVGLLVSALLAVREVREARQQWRRDRLCELLTVRGEVEIAVVGAETDLPQEQVVSLVRETIADRGLGVVVDESVGMLFSSALFQTKTRSLVSVVVGRGQATLEEVARELKLSRDRVGPMLAEAMESGLFMGHVDWRHGVIVASNRGELASRETCPGCGATMSLAGRGVEVCSYCGAEVFLA